MKAKQKKYRDEDYVIDLCNEILGEKALRAHRFDFLRGDARKSEQGVRLPINAYYPEHQLAVEYYEWQHLESLEYVGDRGRMTVNGVKRDEQCRIYDQRKKDMLAAHGIRLITVSYNQLAFEQTKRLCRPPEQDKPVLQKILADVVKSPQ